jgi:hypothetical protein
LTPRPEDWSRPSARGRVGLMVYKVNMGFFKLHLVDSELTFDYRKVFFGANSTDRSFSENLIFFYSHEFKRETGYNNILIQQKERLVKPRRRSYANDKQVVSSGMENRACP